MLLVLVLMHLVLLLLFLLQQRRMVVARHRCVATVGVQAVSLALARFLAP